MVNNCGFNSRFNNGLGCGTPANTRYQTPYSRQNNGNTRNTCNNCDSCNNRNDCDVCDRKQLFENIRAYAFAIIDIGLYLDTNPECEFALEYYNTYRDLHREAVAMYEANYGPLSIYGNEDDDRWKWNCAPWPWEGGDC